MAGFVVAARVAAGQELAAPFLDRLGGGIEAELAEGGGDAGIEERAGIAWTAVAVSADLVVAYDEAI